MRPDRFVSASCPSREESCRALEALRAAFTHHLIYYYFKRLTKGISKCSLRFPASESLYWSCGASWKQQNETISVWTATHGVVAWVSQRSNDVPQREEFPEIRARQDPNYPTCSLWRVSFSEVRASQGPNGPTCPPWGVSFSGVHASQDPGIHVAWSLDSLLSTP